MKARDPRYCLAQLGSGALEQVNKPQVMEGLRLLTTFLRYARVDPPDVIGVKHARQPEAG
jgi:hypothetical protein